MSRTVTFDEARVLQMLRELEKMAGGELTVRLPVSKDRDHLDAIGFAFNILAEEVQYRYLLEHQKATELAATVAELKETQARLVQTAKMAALGEFSSGIAHEINNPLTLIRAHVAKVEKMQASADLPASQEMRNSLKKVHDCVDRMSNILKHVQDFARPNVQVRTLVKLNDVITSSLELTSEQMRMRGIAHAVELSSEDPMVEGNFQELEQVLLNLISNACDAVEGVKSPRIHLASRLEGNHASIEVTDNGSGIEEKFLDRLFEPFFSTKEPGKGTGLGLTISYQIVRAHGGEIIYENPSKGCTIFKIVLAPG